MDPGARMEPGTAPLDVILLAGGQGHRFGSDKVIHPRRGARQVDVVVDRVRALGGTVVIAVGDRPLSVADTVEVPDDAGHQGPLAGLMGGLQVVETTEVAVVAADLVAPSMALLQACARHLRTHQLPGVMPSVGGRPQPLHSVLRADLLDDLRRVAREVPGDGLTSALTRAGVVSLPQRTWRPWAPRAMPARDIDTRSDLRHLS